jgi:hypothetical protein
LISALKILGIFLFASIASNSQADQCASFTYKQANALKTLLKEGDTWLRYCPDCGQREPHPLRIQNIQWYVEGPREKSVNVEGKWYSDADIAARSIPGFGESEYNILLEGNQHRPDHRVTLDNERIDLAYLYYPIGNNQYRNVGIQVNCGHADNEIITWLPARKRDDGSRPEMQWFDISKQCYDGCCMAPGDVISHKPSTLYKEANEESEVIAALPAGSKLRTLSLHTQVKPISVRVVKNHGPFQEGDTFYLLNGLGEGYYNVWYYGKTFEADMAGISTFDMHVGDKSRCRPGNDECWAETDTHSNELWWGEFSLETGQKGWVKEPEMIMQGLSHCD